MFKVIKLKVLIAALILFALVCAALPVTINYVNGKQRTFAATLVIDAGHGGADGGTAGKVTGVKESDLNLAVAKSIYAYAQAADISSVMTRKTVHSPAGGSFNKSADMTARKTVIKNANPDIVLSIHMNKYSCSVRRGIQVFYSTKASYELAETMQNYLNEKLNVPTLGRGFSPIFGDFYILKCSNAPGVIVECGFLSSPDDEALLIDEEYRTLLSYYIFCGINQYLNKMFYENYN